jgi:hypothetical protein
MMAKIEREYYSINEASEIICCSVADLVHLATKGEVKFIVLTSGLQAQRIRQNIIEEKQPYEYINEKFCYVSQDNVAEYEANHSNDYLKISWVYPDDDLENGWGLHPSLLIPATNDSLYMLTADINALLNDPPETESKYKYDAYKLSLDALASNVDIEVLTVEAIYDQLAILDKKLWNISLTTFRRDVWQKYSDDCGIKKQAGRPRRK